MHTHIHKPGLKGDPNMNDTYYLQLFKSISCKNTKAWDVYLSGYCNILNTIYSRQIADLEISSRASS